jgi:soluble lytic murein transglycosylase
MYRFMARRLPPALGRPSNLFSHVMAGMITLPMLAMSVGGPALPEFGTALREHFRAGVSTAALTGEVTGTLATRPDSAERTFEAPDLPPEIAAAPDFAANPADLAATAAPVAAPISLSLAEVPGIPSFSLPDSAPVASLTERLQGAITLPVPEFVEALPQALVAQPLPMRKPVPRAIVRGIPEAELAGLKAAIAAYRKGDLAGGDAHARTLRGETARLAAEWAAIRTAKQAAGFARLARFGQDNPDLPMTEWTLNRAADALFVQKVPPQQVIAFFNDLQPTTSAGKIALARALVTIGKEPQARHLIRDAFRNDKTNATIRAAIVREFPGLIGNEDHRYLALRLVYEGKMSEGLAVAQTAGPQTVQLAQLLAASINENGAAAALLTKLDLALRNEPAALFARAQNFRRTGKFVEAAETLLAAPADPDRIVDGDEWWVERRMLARKLLDSDNAALAYRITAAHQAETSGHIVDAEVHAGWIALRFLKNPAVAAGHFAKARLAAVTPVSVARADYWQGRAAEAMGEPSATEFHVAAAAHSQTFYGQLSLARIGERALPDERPDLSEPVLRGAGANRGLRVIRALIDAEARDLAQPMIIDAAKIAPDMETLVTLGDLLSQYQLPKLTLQMGKVAQARGLFSEEHAFPTFGIPSYEPAGPSAEAAIVYSIARQESEFDAAVISHAGARGLMQLMPATAMRTANRRNMPIDVTRLTTDPILNARIGAAHLADLLGEYNGSYVLSFAAYNAGGKRVREWTTAYGDPRDPAVDVVDWIERIPITETRHYVQKIMENLQVYRARLYGQRQLEIEADLKRGARAPKQDSALPAPAITTARN